MKQVFTADLTRTQIHRIWRAAYFGNRTRCPQCGYARKLWTLSDDRWQCPRCDKKFTLGTDTWVARATLSWTAMYELLHWFELELTDHTIAERVALDYQQVHRFFHRLREATDTVMKQTQPSQTVHTISTWRLNPRDLCGQQKPKTGGRSILRRNFMISLLMTHLPAAPSVKRC